MPVFAIFSRQIDGDLVFRYRNSRGGILVGRIDGKSTVPLSGFCKDVLGFDLAPLSEPDQLHQRAASVHVLDEVSWRGPRSG